MSFFYTYIEIEEKTTRILPEGLEIFENDEESSKNSQNIQFSDFLRSPPIPVEWHDFILKKLKNLPVDPLEYINKLHVELHDLQDKRFQKEISHERLVRQNTDEEIF